MEATETKANTSLGQGVGYGIVLGLGALFALGKQHHPPLL